MSDPVVLLSTGDVVGPAGGVTDNSMVLFSGTSGKLIKGNNAVVTAAGLALLDDVNAGAQRATLGLGTAATANVTTSATDATAGRVMKVGDFGLGAVNTPVIANIDTFSTPSGFYKFTDGTGTKPVGGGAYAYVLINSWNGVTLTQTWIPYGVAQMFVRTATDNNTWGAWREIALINSPAFTGIPTAPTAPQFDNDTSIATTAFVQRALGNLRGFTSVTATTTLTVAQLGTYVQVVGSVPAGQTITLPPLAAVISEGSGYWIRNDSGQTITIKANAAENINGAGNSFILGPWGSVFMSTQGTIQWNLFGYDLVVGNWQDLTGSRAFGTTYTNTTGREIKFQVSSNVSTGNSSLTVNGVVVAAITEGAASNQTLGCCVPPGGTYSASGSALILWTEYR